MKSQFKLTIELVPFTSWYNNMRSLMPKKNWDILRKKVYADFGHRCGICSAKGMLHCHEMWEFDDTKHIQKLVGFIALCPLCHAVKHIGLASLQSHKESYSIETIIEHFQKVNKCDTKEFEKHRTQAFQIWEERSQYIWQLEINGKIIT